jgi:hypothetical protein
MGSAMLLDGMASRADAVPAEYWYFEILASGKGVQADTDSNPPPYPVYSELKDSFSNVLLYARYNRFSRVLTLAYYNEAAAQWVASPDIPAYETEKSVLAQCFPMNYPIYEDSNTSILWANGTIQIQVKEKNGIVENSKLKSLGMGYYKTLDHILAGDTQLMGALTLKGKQVDEADVPPVPGW